MKNASGPSCWIAWTPNQNCNSWPSMPMLLIHNDGGQRVLQPSQVWMEVAGNVQCWSFCQARWKGWQWNSLSGYFCVTSYNSGAHHFGWNFCVCDSFLNPTIEVVTFHLCGWCMLDVFLLPAFTCLGHECQDLLTLCDGWNACVHRLDLGLYSHPLLTDLFWPPKCGGGEGVAPLISQSAVSHSSRMRQEEKELFKYNKSKIWMTEKRNSK